MNTKAVDVLADYLTGYLVAECSMGLAAGGAAKLRATAFFKLRQAFGVGGYATKAEAEESITRTLLTKDKFP
jgi:hypothetical protein